jgi:hypothetical protein
MSCLHGGTCLLLTCPASPSWGLCWGSVLLLLLLLRWQLLALLWTPLVLPGQEVLLL